MESPEDSSNSISTDFDGTSSIEELLAELRDWEDQLKDVDFDFCERPQVGDENKQALLSSKHGGPSPC